MMISIMMVDGHILTYMDVHFIFNLVILYLEQKILGNIYLY